MDFELYIEWDEMQVLHIARQGITPFEVEEVLYEGLIEYKKEGIEGLIAHGRTYSGRYLMIVITWPPEKRAVRCITVRDLTPAEKSKLRVHSEISSYNDKTRFFLGTEIA